MWDEHAAFMDAVFATGAIVLAGPFPDGSALVIVKAPDESAARELFDDDPWTVQDVLAVHDVKEWKIFLDGRGVGI